MLIRKSNGGKYVAGACILHVYNMLPSTKCLCACAQCNVGIHKCARTECIFTCGFSAFFFVIDLKQLALCYTFEPSYAYWIISLQIPFYSLFSFCCNFFIYLHSLASSPVFGCTAYTHAHIHAHTILFVHILYIYLFVYTWVGLLSNLITLLQKFKYTCTPVHKCRTVHNELHSFVYILWI